MMERERKAKMVTPEMMQDTRFVFCSSCTADGLVMWDWTIDAGVIGQSRKSRGDD